MALQGVMMQETVTYPNNFDNAMGLAVGTAVAVPLGFACGVMGRELVERVGMTVVEVSATQDVTHQPLTTLALACVFVCAALPSMKAVTMTINSVQDLSARMNGRVAEPAVVRAFE